MGTWFSSDRERRLWLWTVVVVAGIYSTLRLARTLADELRNRQILDTVFVWCMFLIVGAAVALAFKLRVRGVEIGVALGVVAVYIMAFLRMGIPEERTHLIEYGVVALFVYEALMERAGSGRVVRSPSVIAFAVASAVGVVDELIQLVLPSRVFDPFDMLVNAIAAAMAIGARLALQRARRS